MQIEPIERFRQRFAELGPDLLVIRARITGAQTSQQTLSSSLNWGPGPHVVTTLTLTVTDTVCGPPSDEVRVSYVGGRLEDGTVERTEFMPTDLAMESEHVFVLRAIDGVYYLELGRADLLTLDPGDGFVDAARNRIDVEQLRGLCP